MSKIACNACKGSGEDSYELGSQCPVCFGDKWIELKPRNTTASSEALRKVQRHALLQKREKVMTKLGLYKPLKPSVAN